MTPVSRTIARTAVYAAFAAVLSWVESLLPPLFAFAPGVRLGLANLAVLLALTTLGAGQAAVVLAVKCAFGAIFGGNAFGLVYSLGGGAASFAVSAVLWAFCSRRVSAVAIGVAGACVNNAVQTLVASLVSGADFWALLPFTLGASVLCGACIGFAVWLVLRSVPPRVLFGPVPRAAVPPTDGADAQTPEKQERNS